MVEKVEGIILSVSDYQETSRILQVLTKEHGLIGVIAKGCKSIKSPLRAACNSYTYGYFYIYYKENKLSLLSSVDIINSYSNIRGDIELISYMSYLCDLTYQVVKQNDDNNIYNILISALDKINNSFNPLIITNIVELKYLDYLGISLNLNSCVKCGNREDIVTINSDEGGFICKDCYKDEYIVDKKTIKLTRMYYLVDIKSISSIKISDIVSREINEFINNYYDRYTGLYLKSKEFLNKLIN